MSLSCSSNPLSSPSSSTGALSPSQSGSSNIVKLNVGGVRFWTTKATLSNCGSHFFTALISERIPCIKDDEGYYFIDRNGECFAPILDFLRTGDLFIPNNLSRRAVMREVDFYAISLSAYEESVRVLGVHSDGIYLNDNSYYFFSSNGEALYFYYHLNGDGPNQDTIINSKFQYTVHSKLLTLTLVEGKDSTNRGASLVGGHLAVVRNFLIGKADSLIPAEALKKRYQFYPYKEAMNGAIYSGEIRLRIRYEGSLIAALNGFVVEGRDNWMVSISGQWKSVKLYPGKLADLRTWNFSFPGLLNEKENAQTPAIVECQVILFGVFIWVNVTTENGTSAHGTFHEVD